MKDDLVIIALRTKNGDNVLGLYVGDMESEFTKEPSVVLYRPVLISTQTSISENGVSSSYIPSLYFPLGDVQVIMPVSSILHQTIANPFFSKLYIRIIGELISVEELKQERILKAFDLQDTEDVLSKTKSIFIDTPQNYNQ